MTTPQEPGRRRKKMARRRKKLAEWRAKKAASTSAGAEAKSKTDKKPAGAAK
jgi:hypothetical protein